MRILLSALAVLLPSFAFAAPVGYALAVVTAYAVSDPFLNRLDSAFTEPETGYLEIRNIGDSIFTGTLGTVAASAFAGDLSFASPFLTLPPGQAVSLAIPDNSANVGGFNGPAYFYRPGIEIVLDGTVADRASTEAVSLMVADGDIHSGVIRTDLYGLTSDSFVLQGGDPWGFDAGSAYGLSQAYGTYVFLQAAPEPATIALFLLPCWLLHAVRRRA